MNTKHYFTAATQALIAATVILAIIGAGYFFMEPQVGRAQATSTFTISQTITGEISFLVYGATTTMVGSLNGITGGTSNGSTTVVVQTNSATGYFMDIHFATTTSNNAMQAANNPSSSIYDLPASSTEPNYAFSTASTSAVFGYTVSADDSSDIAQAFLDNGSSACNQLGGSANTNTCWMEPRQSRYRVISRADDAVLGATSTILFRVHVPNNPTPGLVADTYVATATLTAVNQKSYCSLMAMTTFNEMKVVYIALLCLSVFVHTTQTASAQNNTPATSGGVVADITELAATATPAVVEEGLWYTVEELTGVVNQGDFVVGPGRAELEVKPGQTVTYNISIANRISDDRRFELSVEDISGSADGEQSVVLLGDERGPYSIKDYISFPKNTFDLDLGERAKIPVTISVPKDAEPGGYYGSILVSTVKVTAGDVPVGGASSPIVARIGTLFFITVPGEIEQGGELKDFSIVNEKTWYEKGPINFSLLYENTGSIHLNPYGEIRIKNIFNEEVGFVELEPWFSLPKSMRTRDVSWNRELLLGRYTVTAAINRGYDDVVDEKSLTFWVLPWKVVAGTFAVLFIILFSIRFFFRTFEFKRKS